MGMGDLLEQLWMRDACLDMRGDDLVCISAGPLPAHLLAALRFWKDSLMDRIRWTQDPRADDALEDRELWKDLLRMAYDLHGHDPRGLCVALHLVRAIGARLRVTDAGVLIEPGPLREAYQAIRATHLVPHAGHLRWLLARLQVQDDYYMPRPHVLAR